MNSLVLLPKLELHRQTLTAAILLKFFTPMIFSLKVLIEINNIVIANCIFNISLFYQCTQYGKTYKKQTWLILIRSAVLGSPISPPFKCQTDARATQRIFNIYIRIFNVNIYYKCHLVDKLTASPISR